MYLEPRLNIVNMPIRAKVKKKSILADDTHETFC